MARALPSLRCALPLLALAAGPAQAAAPLAQDYTIVAHNPDPEYYIEGSALLRLDDGALLAVVPIVPRLQWNAERRAEHSRAEIVRSEDAGQTWRKVSELPYYSAVPFLHRGALYLLCNKGGPNPKFRNDDIDILRSTDRGSSWSAPVTLFKGHYWNCSTGMVVKNDRLYWALDDLGLGSKRGPCLVACDLTKDPLEPAAWRMSNSVGFPGAPTQVINPAFATLPNQYLEPNVLEVGGRLRVLATVKLARQTVGNLCAVLDAEDDGRQLQLKFNRFNPMPGGQLKFCVIRDEPSQLFWATANLPVDTEGVTGWFDHSGSHTATNASPDHAYWGEGRTGGNDRRFLMLLYSVDGLNWFQAGCVARAPQVNQGFQYARPVVDGDDLAIISRTSVHGPNQHDADYATFHRVRHFRPLALKLSPDSDPP